LGNFIVKFIAFIVFPIYANVFSVEEFGVMALVVTSAALVSVFLEFGLFNSLGRFYWDYDQNKRKLLLSTVIWMQVIWSVIFSAVLLVVIYSFHGQIADRYGVLWIFILLAFLNNIPKQILLFSMTVFRIKFLKWKYILILMLDSLFGILLGLLLILVFKHGLVGYFQGIFLGTLIALPLTLWLIREHIQFKFNRSMAKNLILFGYPFVFSNLAYWLFGSMDRWMLSELSDNTQVGLYSISFKIAMIVGFLGTAFSQTWSPISMKMYADDPNYKSAYSKILSNWFLAMSLLGMILVLFGFEILRFLTPPSYWLASNVLIFVVMG